MTQILYFLAALRAIKYFSFSKSADILFSVEREIGCATEFKKKSQNTSMWMARQRNQQEHTETKRNHALFDTTDGILGIGSDKLYELWLVKIFE